MPATAGYYGGFYTVTGSPAVSTRLAKVRDATLSVETDTIDVTSFDTRGWAENVASFKSWSVDAELLYVPLDTTQEAIKDALFNDTGLKINLFPRDDPAADGFEGNVIVTSYEVGIPVDDAVTISVTLTGTGELTTITKPAA